MGPSLTLKQVGFPVLLGIAGLVVAFISEKEISPLFLTSVITLSAILLGFSSTFVTAMSTADTGTIRVLKRGGTYSRMLASAYPAILSLLCLVLWAMAGFQCRDWSYYLYVLFPLIGFALGSFVQIVLFLIYTGLAEGRRAYEEAQSTTTPEE